jgi:hypothetical protein
VIVKLVATALALGLLSTPALADWRADEGITNADDYNVNVRTVPNGPAILNLPNGVPVKCYERVADRDGDIWTHVIVGNVAGWALGTSLTCNLYGRGY